MRYLNSISNQHDLPDTHLTELVASYVVAIEAAKELGVTWQNIADAGTKKDLWQSMGSTELATRVTRIRKAINEGKRALPPQKPLPFSFEFSKR